MKKTIKLAEVVARIRSQGGLVYAPHPFDQGRSSLGRVLPGLCAAGAVDIVEVFNAKTYMANPYAELARLRRESPVARVKRTPMPDSYFVTRYDDVLAVLRDDERFVHEPWNAGKPKTAFVVCRE